MPPPSLMYLNIASAAGAISLYPGAAGPVSGWCEPIVTVVAVTPGADALLSPPLPPPLEPPQAAAPRASTALTATSCRRVFEDLLVMDTSLSGGPAGSVSGPVL